MDIHAMVQSAVPLLTQFALKVVGAIVLWIIGRKLIEFGLAPQQHVFVRSGT